MELLLIDHATYIFVDYFSKKLLDYYVTELGEIRIGGLIYLDEQIGGYIDNFCEYYCVEKHKFNGGKQEITYVVKDDIKRYKEHIDKVCHEKQVEYWVKSS